MKAAELAKILAKKIEQAIKTPAATGAGVPWDGKTGVTCYG